MNRIALAILVVGLVGCESAKDRCQRIVLEELANKYDLQLEDSASTLANNRLWRVPHPTTEQFDSVLKMVRFNLREDFNKEMRLQYHTDSTGFRTDPLKDSLMQIKPPPRPSDERWASEHCYLGEAR